MLADVEIEFSGLYSTETMFIPKYCRSSLGVAFVRLPQPSTFVRRSTQQAFILELKESSRPSHPSSASDADGEVE
jgi:hypothetical protein